MDSRADGVSGAVFLRGQYLAPYYGTSRTTGFSAFHSLVAVTPSVTQMTLVVATGDGWGDTAAKAEVAVAAVVRCITGMRLTVAVSKTEAPFFYKGRSLGSPPQTHIRVGKASILVGDRLKYLGLLLDSKWLFGHHFDVLAPRVERVSTALGRLLPNLGGPDGRVRHLYVATVNVVALYGCPIWAADLAAMRRAKDK